MVKVKVWEVGMGMGMRTSDGFDDSGEHDDDV